MSRVLFGYRLFGLRLHSDFELPELEPVPCWDEADVTIRAGAVQDDMNDGTNPARRLSFRVPGIGAYAIREGREIVVDADPSAAAQDRHLFLLGSAFGILLHQRGLMPLHANAVVLDGAAFAFTGASGAGKSTLAAWFHDRGHAVLADDVCVLAPHGSDWLAHPGIPRLRLWGEALHASGRSSAGHPRSGGPRDKYDVRMARSVEAPVPLRAIYQLAEPDAAGVEMAIDRLRGVAAVDALVANTYRGGYLAPMGRAASHLQTCLRIAASVPVYGVSRPRGLDRLDAQVAALEAHARGHAASEVA